MSVSISNFDGLRFVVARYKENVDWVPELVSRFPGSKCTIYNKGPSIRMVLGTSTRVLEIKNVGRESHTYLYHIIKNYESDEDQITVFLQGHPFDHCKGSELFDRVLSGVSYLAMGSGFENIGTQLITIDGGVPTFHMKIKDDLEKTSMDLFDKSLPERFKFSAGALFATTRASISKRPLSFYKKAITFLDSEVNPIRGFCFERLWSLIFN